MADEYLAELGFDSGRAIKAIDDLLSRLGRLEQRFGGMERTVSAASKPLLTAQQRLGGTATAADAAAAAVERATSRANRSSAGWKSLAGALAVASAKYAQFRREEAAGTDPNPGKDVYAYRLASLKKYVATADAQNANFIASARERIRVEDEIASRAKASNTTQTNIRAQDAAVTALTAKLERASTAYETFNRAQVVGGGGGRGLASYGSNELAGLVSTAKISGQDSQFIRDAEKRLAAEADLVRRASASGISVTQLKAEDAAIDRLTADLDKASTAYEQFQRSKVTGGTGGKSVDSYSTEQLRQYSAVGAATGQSNAFLTEANRRLVGLNAGLEDGTKNLARLRYAAYDVSFVLGAMGTGGLAAAVAVEKTSVEYDKLFASVQRTSDIDFSTAGGTAELANLRKELVGLTEQLPLTFDEVTQIATLGNQLGIPSAQIVSFTQTVAKFSASSNVGVEDAATAFGRLGQILHDTNYKAMGDDIAYLGVKSVATESQIIGVAQQIAVSTQLAGYNTKQTLALSAALASLGVKQEQSRGTFIRTFGAISAAVNGGGQALNDLGVISEKGSAGFAKEWKTNAAGAFQDFITGLGKNPDALKSTLASFHITAVRDIQTVQLLAQNQKVLADATDDTTKSNGYLDRSYGVVQATIAAKMTVLGNTVKATFDEIGGSVNGAVGFFVDLVSVLAKVQAFVASNPFTSIGAAVGVLALGIVSLGAIGGAALIRLYGNYLALETAFVETDAAQTRFGAGVGRVLGLTSASSAANDRNTASLVKNAGASTEAAGATERLAIARRADTGAAVADGLANESKQLDGVTRSTGSANRGFNGLLGTLGKVGGIIGIAGLVLQLPGLVEGLHQVQLQASGLIPDVDSLTRSVAGLNTEAKTLAEQSLRTGLGALAQGVTGSNALLNLNVGKDGKVADPLGIPGVAGSGTPGYKATTNISAGRAAANFLQTGNNALPGESVAPTADVATAIQEIQTYDALLSGLASSGDQQGFNAAIKIFHQEMHKAGVESEYADASLKQTNSTLKETGGIGTEAAAKLAAFGDTVDSALDAGTSAQQMAQDLTALGSAIGNGDQYATQGSQIAAVLKDIGAAAASPAEAAAQVLGLGDALHRAGLLGADGLANLQAIAASLDPTAKATAFDITGVQKAIDATSSSAAKSVRTLSDYSSDLQGVLQRAFDLKFGTGNALDGIAKGWNDIRDNAKAAGKEIRATQADIAQLKGDKAITEYQLGLAEKYHEYEAAAKLRGDLAKTNSDISDKQKDLTDQKKQGSRILTGNSPEAIANRSSLQGQITNSQTLLTTMAGNGATKAQLEKAAADQKKQFVDQATQLGFNKKEVEKLAGAFDGMSRVIAQVPRKVDIGVKANTSPAEQAITEFLAKASKTSVTIPVKAEVTPTTATVTVSQAPFLDGQKGTPTATPGLPFSLTGKREGGYAGDSPTWAPAGIYHGQEYVLNKQGADMFPRQMLDAANRGVAPQIAKTNVKATLSSGATVSLSRTDRALLGGRGGVDVRVSADRFGDAMDDSFRRNARRGGA